jgi:hypothetical protein
MHATAVQPEFFSNAFGGSLEVSSEYRQAASARDAALKQVAKNADESWLARAGEVLRGYLETHAEFFVDDFWSYCQCGSHLETPRESRALGAVVQAAARNRWMEKSGEFRPSVRSHLTEKPVWRSLIFGTNAPGGRVPPL